jgi:transposase-like protein
MKWYRRWSFFGSRIKARSLVLICSKISLNKLPGYFAPRKVRVSHPPDRTLLQRQHCWVAITAGLTLPKKLLADRCSFRNGHICCRQDPRGFSRHRRCYRRVARALEVNSNVLHRWRREIRQGPGNAFPGDGKQRWSEARIVELQRNIGQQALEIDLLKACLQRRPRAKV